MAPSTASSSTTQSTRKPIDVLPDQLSLFAANVHPIVLISLLLFNFRSLVREPSSTLLGLAPTIAALQLAYCVLCLPMSGQAPPPVSKSAQKKKAAKYTQDLGLKIVPAFLSLFLTITLSAPLLFVTVIMFGGPLVSNTIETLLLALHFALLTSPQLFFAHGLDKHTWLRIASLQLPIDEAYGMSLGACLGAWIGAIPIPLDWDRDWQRWPVTIVAGVYIGAIAGKLIGGYVLKGLKMRIT
ncbi:hypothetical protein AMS68_001424 [Peltaster fructicola]|uniref:Glycosylphosphatidylinositol anchor biosynthesis protein 11 n=1 Tax=Peltaster fructicola TaxID=286661 RepID=A0A6H0XMC8_9PEZI|nr:hypothetical protein AMS68_001424 [Peltaster fructicola]